MKTLSSTYRSEASGDTNAPVEILDVFLEEVTLHLVNYDKNIDFYDLSGVATTYTAFPFGREAVDRSIDNQINTVIVSVANVDRAMSAYLADNDFRGRRCVVRKIFADQLTSSGDANIIFDGVMDTPSADESVIQISITDRIGSLNREAPKRWYQLMCNYKFGDISCFFGQSSGDMYNTTTGTCDADSSITYINDSARSEADNYWIDGDVTVQLGSNGIKKRKVVSSTKDSGFGLDVALPAAPAVGASYTIRRGCDKTWLRCSGDFSNDQNFGGFPTIPEQMVIR